MNYAGKLPLICIKVAWSRFYLFFSRGLEAGEETRLTTMLTAAEKAAGKLPVSS